MKAVQYVEFGKPVEVREIPAPQPGPGQVLLKVTAAGVCHSDIFVMSQPPGTFGSDAPLTLGHEGAGTVAALGDGVTGFEIGDAVVVYGPWGCGSCHACAQGKENYCTRAEELGIRPPGLGAPGALADYVLVDDARHLVPIGDLDPIQTVPLTDAGLTPYHAIKRSLDKLYAGSTAVVLGVGGLGHIGVQLIRALSTAQVIALDVSDDKLELARKSGAHLAIKSDDKAADIVREATNGLGAQVVLDFAGVQPTVDLAVACAGVESDLTIVGIGGGVLPVGFGRVPYECSVSTPYWGSRSELIELIDLARHGAVSAHVEKYALTDAPDVYDRLHHGRINGRAVLIPG
ncbi:NAD(P)-dependent alcohol dehydrogenase [Streptomyces sp. SID3343]|uniref:NAD(P)-dependent alcohol dehydrogenase n=1 Tax=Streptomyces sp. SID3343 TaxID=2690260 RepID=UPI00136B9081|nr:NAD(P)-dependent alcohol dehydrogenase [Streptomyces sp. SID3343]MYV98624.1 alcohol dehydrogenase catalytic domain-containing protein [Streptomyces sp. SID3343]